ncbi:MAG: ImmA/IrrE family metallo-endopeptidase [Mycobacteriaceae bacterium]
MASRRVVADAVAHVLDLAPKTGPISLSILIEAVARERERPIDIISDELPPGVCGEWRQYQDADLFILQRGLPTRDRTLAHELGHVVLGHQGVPIVQAATDNAEVASESLIAYMLSQRSGCLGTADGERAEQEAEDFAAMLIYRLGRLPSDRSSIVQLRLGEAFG